MTERWFDREAGPIVRPYTLTRGRTKATGAQFDLIAMVVTIGASRRNLPPEHMLIMNACRAPISVAEVSAETGLAIGVVRVLLGDLRDAGLIILRLPAAPIAVPRESLLRDVLAGLRSL